jgi:hypothetical protein
MQQTTGVLTTMARAMDTQPERLSTSLTTRSLPTPWWRPAVCLRRLQTWMRWMPRRQVSARRDLRPPFPRQETPVDILARKHTFLYACSLAG